MLSISARNATPSDIRAYLEGERDGANRGAEDYYTVSGHTRGRWLGSGASELQLAGEVNEQTFDRLAAGFHPETGAALVQRAGGTHRPGWDLTFSVPKSVSVVWGIAEEEQREAIERAHIQAVERTLKFAEQQKLFITRRGHNGIERESARPIIATYLHGTSREADPQLHTHAFVLNVAARGDGSYGTLETKPLYEWKMALGAAYRAELAQELRTLGYETAPGSKGSFRLSHVPRDLERHFSKRRAQIESVMNERGTTSAKAAEVAALNTRKAKESSTATTLRSTWRSESLTFGVTTKHLVDLARHLAQDHKPISTQAVIEHLGREHSTFTSADLARAAAEHTQHAGGGIARTSEMMTMVANDAEIVPLAANRYTTREMLQIELGALTRAKRLSEDIAYSVDPSTIAVVDNNRSLSEEQRAALNHLIEAPRLRVLEGLAGTGKSHLLGAAREAWEANGYEVRGAALAGKAAKGLQTGSGIRSQTVHSLLNDVKHGRNPLTNRTVLVIDEAGMIGSRQFARLLEATDQAQAKIVLVGDANQLQPIEAGQLFERIGQEVGVVRLTDIRRQRGAADREMVRALASGDMRAALDSLQARGRVHTAADLENTMRELVHDWAAARDAHKPNDDLMLGATRADTRELNRLARKALREQGDLQRERIIEAAQGPLALAEGDRIVITRNTKLLGMMNGDLATVTALTERHGEVEITAQLDEGRTRTWRVRDHPHVEHGYALTVHKAQGASVERAYVLAHESMSAREWSYVAGSRAREAVHLYAERNTADDLERIMERSHKKDTALDHLPAAVTKTFVELER
jgi:conjugative relaxase-like TrwC/TraI family protein